MSESRDTGTGLGGKEWKRTKHSDVSKEGNVLPSTPSQTATDAKPSGEGNVDLPFQKPADSSPVTQGHDDQTHDDDVISQSKWGGSSKVFKRGKFLFELQLTRSDVEKRHLFIPGEESAGYLPTGTPENSHIEKIKISNTRNDNWYMKIIYFPQDHSFVIANGWQDFVDRHNLEIMDVIRFYRPGPTSHDNHFLIESLKRKEAKTNSIPEFKQENFLFGLQLAPSYVKLGCLIVPREEVRKHFPVIQTRAEDLMLERLKFTDAQSNDWLMRIIFDKNNDDYRISNGWEEFVKERNLEAMDVIKFYKPVQPSHARHFLIDYVKKGEAAGTNLPQSGSATNEGNSAKGKEVAVGHEKPPGGLG